MALSLNAVQDLAPTGNVAPPLTPIPGDDGAPAVLVVSPTLTIGVCTRPGGEPMLCRLKPGKDETPDAWRVTGRVADVARAISGGLLV